MYWLVLLAVASGCRIGFDWLGDSPELLDGRNTSDAVDLDSGLVAWFKLDETTGSLAADSSGADNHGFIYQFTPGLATWTMGRVDGGLHFDNTDGVMGTFGLFPSADTACPSPLVYTSSVTATAWVRFDRFQDWGGYTLSDVAIMHGSNGGIDGGWGLGATNGCETGYTVGFAVTGPADTRSTRCGATALALNTWHHIAGVYDAGAQTVDVYLNGIKDNGFLTPGSVAIPSTLNSPVQCVFLATGTNQYNLLSGALDQVRVYQRPLNDSEIAALYAAGG